MFQFMYLIILIVFEKKPNSMYFLCLVKFHVSRSHLCRYKYVLDSYCYIL